MMPRSIEQIDKDIDANHAAVLSRLHCLPETAWGWQSAWSRCADLHAREHELFRERGAAQLRRDTRECKAFMKQKRAQQQHDRAYQQFAQSLRRIGLAVEAA